MEQEIDPSFGNGSTVSDTECKHELMLNFGKKCIIGETVIRFSNVRVCKINTTPEISSTGASQVTDTSVTNLEVENDTQRGRTLVTNPDLLEFVATKCLVKLIQYSVAKISGTRPLETSRSQQQLPKVDAPECQTIAQLESRCTFSYSDEKLAASFGGPGSSVQQESSSEAEAKCLDESRSEECLFESRSEKGRLNSETSQEQPEAYHSISQNKLCLSESQKDGCPSDVFSEEQFSTEKILAKTLIQEYYLDALSKMEGVQTNLSEKQIQKNFETVFEHLQYESNSEECHLESQSENGCLESETSQGQPNTSKTQTEVYHLETLYKWYLSKFKNDECPSDVLSGVQLLDPSTEESLSNLRIQEYSLDATSEMTEVQTDQIDAIAEECVSDISTEEHILDFPTEERFSDAQSGEYRSGSRMQKFTTEHLTQVSKPQGEFTATKLEQCSLDLQVARIPETQSEPVIVQTKILKTRNASLAQQRLSRVTSDVCHTGIEIPKCPSRAPTDVANFQTDPSETQTQECNRDFHPDTPEVQTEQTLESETKRSPSKIKNHQCASESTPSEAHTRAHLSEVQVESSEAHPEVLEAQVLTYCGGDKICECSPFVYILDRKYIKTRCSNCLKTISSYKTGCKTCSFAYYCNQNCKDKHLESHKRECLYLRRADLSRVSSGVRLMANAMWKLQDPSSHEIGCTVGNKTYYYRDLPSHAESMLSDPLNAAMVVFLKETHKQFQNFIKDNYISFEEFCILHGKVAKNMANILEAPLKKIGAGMYFALAAVKRCCLPNSNMSFIGPTASIIACRNISLAESDEVSLRFGSSMIPRNQDDDPLFGLFTGELCYCELCMNEDNNDIINEQLEGEEATSLMADIRSTLDQMLADNLDECDKGQLEVIKTVAVVSLARMDKTLGLYHYLRGMILQYAADASMKLKHFTEAYDYYTQLLPIQRYIFGNNYPTVLDTLWKLGLLNYEMNHPQEAKECFSEALELAYYIYSTEHPFFINTRYMYFCMQQINFRKLF